jgi:hypothetical protein
VIGLVLTGIVAAGAWVRIYALARESIWIDEALSVRLASGSLGDLWRASAQDGHPPLYLAVQHLALSYWGRTEAAVRAPSALFGILAIPAFFALGQVLFSTRAGLLAALLLAACPYHIYYSQEARNYSLLTLLVILSHWGFALHRQRPARGRAAFYCIATLAMLYTHVFGFFVWFSQMGLILLVRLAKRDMCTRPWRTELMVQGAIGAGLVFWLFGPWAATLSHQAQPGTTALMLARPTLWQLLISFIRYSGSLLTLLLLLPWLVVACWWSWRAASSRDASLAAADASMAENIAGLWLVLAATHLTPFVYSLYFVPVYITRATIVALPAFLLLAAFAIARQRIGMQILVGLTIAGFMGLSQHQYYSLASKEDWRGLSSYIERQAMPGDALVFDAGYGQEGYRFYSRRQDLHEIAIPGDMLALRQRERLRAVRNLYPRIWLIRFQRAPQDAAILQAMGSGHVLVLREHTIGIDLYLFVRTSAIASPSS